MGGLKPMERNDRRKMILPTAAELRQKCADLRYIVEHQNKEGKILLRTGVTVDRDPKTVMTTKVDGIEIGYRVLPSSPLELNAYFDREIYIKIPGYKFSDLNEEERTKLMSTVFECFIEAQQGKPHIEPIKEDCVLIRQRFMVAFFHKFRQSTIQVPGGMA
jgi:hypothetical protein